jgi:pimeloyl-ACP methyl ester carboxylesterase
MLIFSIFLIIIIAAPFANFANASTLNIQDIPTKKVHVGDKDIAYKTFGKGDPILLISGYSFARDGWDSTLLETLASNHTVIVFDNRGIGNTTSGSEQKFSISLFSNDTAGLLEALNCLIFL